MIKGKGTYIEVLYILVMICLLNYLVHIRYVLLMREDLTVNFARAIARCGLAANNVKRYDIDTVYNESDAG